MKKFFLDLWKKSVGFFRRERLLKLISLLIAVFIWFLICEYVDPQTDTPISGIPITVDYEGSVPQKEGLGIMTAVDETVSVRIRGSRDSIALMDHTKITASLDLSNVTKSGIYDLPVKISTGAQNITLVSQSVSTVKVQFDKNIVSNVKVDVSVVGNVPEGYIREEPTMLNNYITVSGPEAIVSKIESAKVEIKQDSFTETNTFSCDYTFLDSEMNEVPKTFLTMDVEMLSVTVVVVKEKNVPLTVQIFNSSGGKDSLFCTAETDPATVYLTGNTELLDGINTIDLGMIDVAEKSDDFEVEVPLVVPNGVKNVNNVESAKVSIRFNDVVYKTFTVTNLILDNLPSGKNAAISEDSITVTVRGPAEDVNKLTADQISLFIDTKNQTLSAGTSRFSAYAVFPDGVNVGAVGKYQLTVVVS